MPPTAPKASITDFGNAEDALLRATNSNVITKYIQYVKAYTNNHPTPNSIPVNLQTAWLNCTQFTVVNDFCGVLSHKIGMANLRPATIKKLIDNMNVVAYDGTENSQRAWAIGELCSLAGGQYSQPNSACSTISGEIPRSWFTPERDALTTVTMAHTKAGGGSYIMRQFLDTTAQPVPFTTEPTEVRQKTFSSIKIPFKNTNVKIDSIKRKRCGTCWICNNIIYVYEIKDNQNKHHYVCCGEDEHVLPPGWGNIIGILWSDKTDQINYNVNTNRSLRPSHTWCNQLKNDELFLRLPHFNAAGNFVQFTINEPGILRFKKKGVNWLTKNKLDSKEHNMFHKFHKYPTNEDFMDGVEITVKAHMNGIITDLNTLNAQLTSQQNLNVNGTPYIIFMLRTILCIVYVWTKVKAGFGWAGGGQTGGAVHNSADTDPQGLAGLKYQDIPTDLLASCIYEVRDVANAVKSELICKSIKDSAIKFALNEKNIICHINDLPSHDYDVAHSFNYQGTDIIEFEPQHMVCLGYQVGKIIGASYLFPEELDYDNSELYDPSPDQILEEHNNDMIMKYIHIFAQLDSSKTRYRQLQSNNNREAIKLKILKLREYLAKAYTKLPEETKSMRFQDFETRYRQDISKYSDFATHNINIDIIDVDSYKAFLPYELLTQNAEHNIAKYWAPVIEAEYMLGLNKLKVAAAERAREAAVAVGTEAAAARAEAAAVRAVEAASAEVDAARVAVETARVAVETARKQAEQTMTLDNEMKDWLSIWHRPLLASDVVMREAAMATTKAEALSAAVAATVEVAALVAKTNRVEKVIELRASRDEAQMMGAVIQRPPVSQIKSEIRQQVETIITHLRSIAVTTPDEILRAKATLAVANRRRQAWVGGPDEGGKNINLNNNIIKKLKVKKQATEKRQYKSYSFDKLKKHKSIFTKTLKKKA